MILLFLVSGLIENPEEVGSDVPIEKSLLVFGLILLVFVSASGEKSEDVGSVVAMEESLLVFVSMTVEDSVECVDEEVVLTILLVFVSAIVTGSEVGVDSVLGVVGTIPLVIISAIVEYSEIIESDSAIDTEVVIGIILLVLFSMSV